MSGSREESPDWLRSFQPPTQSVMNLSSGSESPLDQSPVSDEEDNIHLSRLFKKEKKLVSNIKDLDDARETESDNPVKGKSPNKGGKVKRTPEKKRKNYASERGKRAKRVDVIGGNTPENPVKSHGEKQIWSLSSDSESSPDARPVKKSKTNKKNLSANNDIEAEFKKENDDHPLDEDVESLRTQAPKFESPERKLEKEDDKSFNDDNLLNHEVESLKNQGPKVKSPLGKLKKEDEITFKEKNLNSSINGDTDTTGNFVKEDISGKRPGLQVSSSRLPLLLSEKVQRSKALVECEGDSLDLSGDVGSVGRIVISDDSSNKHEMFLDLKGTIYKTTIVPSRTFCVVSFGQSEAKIEAIMNDYIQLKPQSNIYEAETMVEGTLDGFSFDSDEEADKAVLEADQEAAEEQTDGKTKRKPDKKPGVAKKKGKTAGEKPSKKVKKNPRKGKSKK